MISHNQQNVLSFLFQFGVRLERVSQIKALYFGRCNVHCCPPVENLPNSVKKGFQKRISSQNKKSRRKSFFFHGMEMHFLCFQNPRNLFSRGNRLFNSKNYFSTTLVKSKCLHFVRFGQELK